jgi:hypothetical protein
MARGGHGLHTVSLGPAMPFPSTPRRRATPETAISWVASPQGRRPVAVFYPLGHPAPYTHRLSSSTVFLFLILRPQRQQKQHNHHSKKKTTRWWAASSAISKPQQIKSLVCFSLGGHVDRYLDMRLLFAEIGTRGFLVLLQPRAPESRASPFCERIKR